MNVKPFNARVTATHGFVYNRTMWNLNDLLAPDCTNWTIDFVYSINNNGWIVGHGYKSVTLETGAVVLIPRTVRCQYQDLIDSEWPLMAANLGLNGNVPNTPGTHILERWGLAMVANVLCNASCALTVSRQNGPGGIGGFWEWMLKRGQVSGTESSRSRRLRRLGWD